MTDHEERKALLSRVLLRWHAKQSVDLLPAWMRDSESIKTGRLRMAVDELCTTWNRSRKPEVGDLVEIANRERPNAGPRGTEITLEQLRELARHSLDAIDFYRPTEADITKRMRTMLSSRGDRRIRLTREAWAQALAQRLVTRSDVPFAVGRWAEAEEQRCASELSALYRAGLIWCDRAESFVPRDQAVDLTAECEREGNPWPRDTEAHEIHAAFEALERGDLVRGAPARSEILDPVQEYF